MKAYWRHARAPQELDMTRRQLRAIRNSAQRFEKLGYAMAQELHECFPEAFVNRGKGKM